MTIWPNYNMIYVPHFISFILILSYHFRNVPHGVCFPHSNNGSGKSKKSPVLKTDEDPQYESAATILRHSYYNNNSTTYQNEFKTRNQNQNALIKSQKDKPVSKIRLRPRQMLCSNCKASCYETDKGIVTLAGAPKQNLSKSVETPSSSNKIELRSKRQLPSRDAKSATKLVKSESTPNVRTTLNSLGAKPSVAVRPVVNLNSIKAENALKSCSVTIDSKPDITKQTSSLTVTSSPSKTSTVNVNSSKSATINVNTIKTSTVNVSTSTSSTVNVNTSKMSTVNVNATKSSTINLNTRASPFIKISIGEGTVVQIPPRIHGDEVDGGGSGEGGDTSQAEDTNMSADDDSEDTSSHRKIKKVTKKFKEREKSREDFLDIVEKSVEIESDHGVTISHHKKHKRKHKHKHGGIHDSEVANRDKDLLDGIENENIDTSQNELLSSNQRPRLLYTWRQNKGLSPRRDVTAIRTLSPRRDTNNSVPCNNELYPKKEEDSYLDINNEKSGSQKEYKLRSKEKSQSMESLTEEENSPSDNESSYSIVSTQSSSENEEKLEESFEIDIQGCETNEEEEMEEGPPNNSNLDIFRPLMMKIQTREVNKCVTSDGRKIHVGDIVWGKIQGFPWWPGRVLSISTSQRDNGLVLRQLAHVSWFGSSTMSHIQCSDLYPFVEDFKVRYNKKKKGPYKMAIKQATIAAQSITSTHQIDFAEFDI